MPLLASTEELKDLSTGIVITLAIKGEIVAMEELVRRQQGTVRQFMYRLCHNSNDADDLAQQVFLRMWQALPQLRAVDAYFGWQKQLMINVWKESLRRHKLRFDDSEVAEESIDRHAANLPLKHDLAWALSTLSAEKRLCIVLAYHDGLSHPEIAAVSGLAPGTVKSHINRGSKTLRKLLEAYVVEKAS